MIQHDISLSLRDSIRFCATGEGFLQRERSQTAEQKGRAAPSFGTLRDLRRCNEIPAGDAETLAEALEEAGSGVAELMELRRQGALFIQ